MLLFSLGGFFKGIAKAILHPIDTVANFLGADSKPAPTVPPPTIAAAAPPPPAPAAPVAPTPAPVPKTPSPGSSDPDVKKKVDDAVQKAQTKVTGAPEQRPAGRAANILNRGGVRGVGDTPNDQKKTKRKTLLDV
jgi:hypothetical protein